LLIDRHFLIATAFLSLNKFICIFIANPALFFRLAVFCTLIDHIRFYQIKFVAIIPYFFIHSIKLFYVIDLSLFEGKKFNFIYFSLIIQIYFWAYSSQYLFFVVILRFIVFFFTTLPIWLFFYLLIRIEMAFCFQSLRIFFQQDKVFIWDNCIQALFLSISSQYCLFLVYLIVHSYS
jgi:hypothetical protein